MKGLLWLSLGLGLLVVLGTGGANAAVRDRSPGHPPTHTQRLTGTPTAREFGEARGRNFGNHVAECPHAGFRDDERPLSRIDRDRVWSLSERGDDIRFNYDLSCFPQNETSVAINPHNTRNLVGGANDYQGDYNQFDASTTRGERNYGSVNPNPSNPFAYNLTQSDPVFVYDRDGVAYNQEIAFAFDDSNGVFVWRSTNGGFTWTRPCVPFPGEAPDPPDAAVCGGPGDPRQPGDGVITWNQDPTPGSFDNDAPFDDKNWLAAGPRPDGVEPVCFTPVTHTPTECDPDVVGSDRLHATWTRFHTSGCDEENEFEIPCEGRIWHSYSDDQARSWSPPKPISGSAAFCVGIGPLGEDVCDDNQFSVPTVHPRTGLVGVSFQNFNTPHESQYLFVRSRDGGNTFQGPFFVSPVFDANYPTGATRPDCVARGQSESREVLTNSCFRVNSGGNVAVDKRGNSMTSGFGDDFYLVLSDNRNGTAASSNTDVFFFRSTDGGSTWIGPTRVNDDRSVAPANRDCGPAPACGGNFGNDQWFPWVDVNSDGVLAVTFYDRRLDEDSVEHAWPTSRQRSGNYLTWRWGAGCDVDRTPSRECLAADAAAIPQPTAPIDPGAGPVPGQGPRYVGPFANSVVSDVPSNMDYSFRAGLFMGDYDQVSYPNFPQLGNSDVRDALAIWTDARNGRGSGAPTSFQAGRNPACEQADMFMDYFNPLRADDSDAVSESEEELFLVTPCPGDDNGDNDND
jgi:hypothetical protein